MFLVILYILLVVLILIICLNKKGSNPFSSLSSSLSSTLPSSVKTSIQPSSVLPSSAFIAASVGSYTPKRSMKPIHITILSLLMLVLIYMSLTCGGVPDKETKMEVEKTDKTGKQVVRDLPQSQDKKENIDGFTFELSPCKQNCYGRQCCFKPYFEHTSDAQMDRGYTFN